MRLPTLPTVVVLALVLLTAAPAQGQRSGGSETGAPGAAAAKQKAKPKGKAKPRTCRKGYVLKTVRVKRKGKTVRVKRCRKRAARKKAAAPDPARPQSPAPGGQQPGANPPGGADPARAFVEGKLANSRFTDCPGGWPSCIVEHRYSHVAGGTFHSCRLTPGPKTSFTSTYAVQNPVVGGDGSWSVDTTVPESGVDSVYKWHVAADGTVTGYYLRPGEPQVELPSLQYVAGARDCSS